MISRWYRDPISTLLDLFLLVWHFGLLKGFLKNSGSSLAEPVAVSCCFCERVYFAERSLQLHLYLYSVAYGTAHMSFASANSGASCFMAVKTCFRLLLN